MFSRLRSAKRRNEYSARGRSPAKVVSAAVCGSPRPAAAGTDEISARWPVSRVLSSPSPARDGHSSGTSVTGRLARPTRTTGRKPPRPLARAVVPTWSCSRWGLPCRRRYRRRGALLPHPFTLAGRRNLSRGPAVCFLWHCPWGCPRRALPGTVLPWSPDFPHPASGARPSGHLAHLSGKPAAPSGQAAPAAIAARWWIRLVVSGSLTPSIRAGRKWRWTARTTASVIASNTPVPSMP